MNEITDDIEHEDHMETKKPSASSSGNIVSVLEGRQDMYSKAIATAKSSGDASKSRRLERQFKVEIFKLKPVVLIFLSLGYSRFTEICPCRPTN